MKGLMVLALTSLCFLAMATVRIRNNEILIGYRIAEIEREERHLRDQLMALRSEMAHRITPTYLLARAAELGIRLQLQGFEDVLLELVRNPGEDRIESEAFEDVFYE